MIFCGIPIFFQEVAVGQYLGAGGMTLVGQLCPILQGELQQSGILPLSSGTFIAAYSLKKAKYLAK
jgi:SNF family Na+-dependent transporter